ncbi:hypothetical protein KCW65_25135, partial [Mycobacterium tuberculosis]|nr:hypothetical protein [Mycobacterium tuberculosis]
MARGTSLTFGETPAGTTNLGRYASRYSCTADGKPISPSGSGTCRITRFDGTTANVTLTGAAEQTLSEQVRPGDTVECCR